MTDNQFESMIESNAASLKNGVKYSGAASSAKERKKSGAAVFMSSAAAPLAAVTAAAVLIGGGSYFLIRSRMNNDPEPPATSAYTEPVDSVTETTDGHTAVMTDTDETTGGDTAEDSVTTEQDSDTHGLTTVTPDTQEPGTEDPQATDAETTAPVTSEPDTTVPHTTAPAADPGLDKNGYKLTVNGRDISKTAKFGTDGDGDLILPFSVILNELSHASAKITGEDTATLTYEGDVFTLNAAGRTMTGNNYSGDWFKNKQSQTLKLYIEDGVLYADSGTVSAFLSEFAGGGISISGKTIAASDFYNGDDTPYTPPETTAPVTDPAPAAVYRYSDIFDTDVTYFSAQEDVRKFVDGMTFKETVKLIGKPHAVYADNDSYFVWCVEGGHTLFLECCYEKKANYPSPLHKFSDMYENGTFRMIPAYRYEPIVDYMIRCPLSTYSAVQYGDFDPSGSDKGNPVKVDETYQMYHLETRSIQKNRSLLEWMTVYDDPLGHRKNPTPDTYVMYVEVIDAGAKLSKKSHTLSVNDRKIWICDKNGNRIDYVMTNNKGAAQIELFSGEYTLKFEETDDAAVLYDLQSFRICYKGNSGPLYSVRNDIPKDPDGTEHRLMRIFIYDKREFVPIDVTVIDTETNAPVSGYELIWEGGKYVSDDNGKIHIEPIDIYSFIYLFKTNKNPYVPTAYISDNTTCSLISLKADFRKEGYTDQTDIYIPLRDGDQSVYVSRGYNYDYIIEIKDENGDPVSGVEATAYFERKTTDENGAVSFSLPSEYAFEILPYDRDIGKYYFRISKYEVPKEENGIYQKSYPLDFDLPKYPARISILLYKQFFTDQQGTPLACEYRMKVMEITQLTE